MSKVILDSWGISEILYHVIYQQYFRYSDSSESLICRQNFLTALVLWDDIYLNTDLRSIGEIGNIRGKIYRLFEILEYPSFIHSTPLINQGVYASSRLGHEVSRAVNEIATNITDDNLKTLLLRGGLYLIHANRTGITYLPHPFRANFFQESGIFKREFDSRIYIDIVDKGVREYIEAINELAQFQLMSTSFPILYKFISKIAKNPLDEFRVALDLRKDKNVSLFRESVNDVSEELKKGNIHAVRASLMKTKEICDEITDGLYKKPLSYGVSIGLSPSIEINHDSKPKVASGFHTTFLSDLANFALKGDIPKRYMFED